MHRTRTLLSLAATAGLTLLPSPAWADKPAEHDVYKEAVTDLVLPTPEEGPDATFCGLVGVPLHTVASGSFAEQTRGSSAYPFFRDVFRITDTYTNPTTDLTFTVATTANDKDLTITDNGDGTITVVHQMAGIQSAYGPTGEVLFTDRGLFRITVLIDTAGTVDPEDDTFLGVEGEPVAHGQHDLDRDFCEDFLTVTAAP